MRHFMTVDSPNNGDTTIWCVEKASTHDALARIQWAFEDGFPVSRVLNAALRLQTRLQASNGMLGGLYRPEAVARLLSEVEIIISRTLSHPHL